MEYILIDGSYFVFYRVFALQIWWKNAKPHDDLTNPYENEEFLEKFESTFKSKIIEIKKKLKMQNALIIVGKDCPQEKIWRKSLYPQYKHGRNVEKNNAANIGKFFQHTYEQKLFERSGASHILEMDNMEADDCLALTAKYLQEKNKNNKITIITSDHDYIQLANENIQLINLKFKSLLESKAYSGEPEKDLFFKIIMGDKSDNILPVFKKCGKVTAEKYYNDNVLFMDKLAKENAHDKYKLNKTLVDFNEIPNNLKDLFYNYIKTLL
jgi:5'-3' exonuclease